MAVLPVIRSVWYFKTNLPFMLLHIWISCQYYWVFMPPEFWDPYLWQVFILKKTLACTVKLQSSSWDKFIYQIITTYNIKQIKFRTLLFDNKFHKVCIFITKTVDNSFSHHARYTCHLVVGIIYYIIQHSK